MLFADSIGMAEVEESFWLMLRILVAAASRLAT